MSGPAGNKASGDPARKPIGVFVLDDHEIVRQGVRALLEAEPDIRVIGEADTASAALAAIVPLRPDVAMLDVRLPDGDGVSVCRGGPGAAAGSGVPDVISFSDDEAPLDSILAGAAGYVLTQIGGPDLSGAVRVAASGRSLLPPRAASQVVARLRGDSGKPGALAAPTPAGARRLGADPGKARAGPGHWSGAGAPLSRLGEEVTVLAASTA